MNDPNIANKNRESMFLVNLSWCCCYEFSLTSHPRFITNKDTFMFLDQNQKMYLSFHVKHSCLWILHQEQKQLQVHKDESGFFGWTDCMREEAVVQSGPGSDTAKSLHDGRGTNG